jgi:aspartate 1-decarboxylase
MFVKLLKSKIHQARVTDTKLRYAGSIAIDPELMEAADIRPYEAVLIADVDNGNRLETYAIPAEHDSGEITILGAAANLIKKGDTIIIFTFGHYTPEQADQHEPKVVIVDEKNEIVKSGTPH